MSQNRVDRVPAGKMIAGIIIAVLAGVLFPFITLIEMATLSPVVLTAGVLVVFLQCFAGWIPAALLIVLQLVSTGFFMGNVLMGMMLLASVIPAILILRGIHLKKPFFEQMRNGLVFSVGGMILAVFVAYLCFGSDMIAQMMDALRAQFDLMPDELIMPFVDTINSALSMMNGGTAQTQAITVETYRAQVMGVFDLLQEAYSQSLPGTLLTGAVIFGGVSVLWGNWMKARRGLATPESFIGMSRWYLPGQITAGLLFLWVVSYFIVMSGSLSGETVYITIYLLIHLAFTVQALASFDRRFLKRGIPAGRRYLFVALILLASQIVSFLNTALFLYGAASALFGSKGAFRLWMQKHQNDNSNNGSDR